MSGPRTMQAIGLRAGMASLGKPFVTICPA